MAGRHRCSIGLGGSGTAAVKQLHGLEPGENCLELDIDSSFLNGICLGYAADVVPAINIWALNSPTSRTWYDLHAKFSPIRELPDLFARTATRSMMRAVFKMHEQKFSDQLRSCIEDADDVYLFLSPYGTTGSAWLLDVIEIIKTLNPTSIVHVVLLPMNRRTFSLSLGNLLNAFWMLRELGSFRATAQFVGGSSQEGGLLVEKSENGEYLRVEQVSIDDFLQEIEQKISEIGFVQGIFRNSFTSSLSRPLSQILDRADLEFLMGLVRLALNHRFEFENISPYKWPIDAATYSSTGEKLIVGIPEQIDLFPSVFNMAFARRWLGRETHGVSYVQIQEIGREAMIHFGQQLSVDESSRLKEIIAGWNFVISNYSDSKENDFTLALKVDFLNWLVPLVRNNFGVK